MSKNERAIWGVFVVAWVAVMLWVVGAWIVALVLEAGLLGRIWLCLSGIMFMNAVRIWMTKTT